MFTKLLRRKVEFLRGKVAVTFGFANGIRKTAKELRKAPKMPDFLNIVINTAF